MTQREAALELATALNHLNSTKQALTKSSSAKEREAMRLNLADAGVKIAMVRDILRTEGLDQ